MRFFKLLAVGAVALNSGGAFAGCAYENDVPIKSLSAGFEAWKAVTEAMAECGNLEAELDQEFRTKQPAAFAAEPSLYHIGGVSNGTFTPLFDAKTIRPLDDLVAKYGQQLKPNQLIRVDGQTWAIAMMVNAQHLMYRNDIFADLGITPPTTYEEFLAAAETIRNAGVVDYPVGGTYKTGWNLAQEFVNNFFSHGGDFFDDNNMPTINNEAGIATLKLMKALTDYMDPEYLTSDSTYVQQQFQQGKIAMSNLWASRAAAMDDPSESTVVGKVTMAGAPQGPDGTASTLWWDGIVIAANITDDAADAAFRLAMEGMDSDMVTANNDAAVWLIDGYVAGPAAAGAAATAASGARPYPSLAAMGLMHTALGSGVSDYLTGAKDAATTLADIEAEYLTAARDAGLIN